MKKLLLFALLFCVKQVNAQCPVTITGNTVICSGTCTTLTVSGGTTYTWSANAGSANTPTVNVCPTSNTIFTVTAMTGTCIATQTVAVNVNSLPVVTASVTSGSMCSGGGDTLTGYGATTYTWNTGATASTIYISPPFTSTFTVAGTDANGCMNTATVSVNVNPLPTITVNSASVCLYTAACFTASGASTYTWSPNTAINTINGAYVCANPTVTTNYTVVGTDVNGCSNYAVANFIVIPNPTVTASASNGSMCFGGGDTLYAYGAITYAWSPATGLSATTGAPVYASPQSAIIYTVTGSIGTCTSSATVSLNVMPSPMVNFTITPNASPHVWDVNPTFSGGTPPYTYIWNWGDSSPNSNTAYPSHTYTVPAWYNVCATIADGNGCTSTFCQNDTLYRTNSSMITVNVINSTTGINQSSANNKLFSVFPNPFNESISVNYSLDENSFVRISLIDIIGKESVLYNENLQQTGNHAVKIDSKSLSLTEGIYFLKIETKNKTFFVKLVKN